MTEPLLATLAPAAAHLLAPGDPAAALARAAVTTGPGGFVIITSRRALASTTATVAGFTVVGRYFVDDAVSPRVAVRATDARAALLLITELAAPDRPAQLATWWVRRTLGRLRPQQAVATAAVLQRA